MVVGPQEDGQFSSTPSGIVCSSLSSSQKALYDEFVLNYGNILEKSNSKLTDLDADKYVISALEHKDKISGRISTSDILFKRTINPVREIHKTDNIQDAITLSLQK